MADPTLLRIGELSRRAGVSPELLRAWERRYGLLRPVRSAGGLRLYSPEDLERVELMRRHLAAGIAAAEAAAMVTRGPAAAVAEGSPGLRIEDAARQLGTALESFDDAAAHALLDDLLAAVSVDALLAAVILPYLQEVGERWERGEVSVAQEHFATNVLRGRLLGLARGWGRGMGPWAVLACPPGEQHDLPLIAFGLALRSRGWRIGYLGPDTPIDTVGDAARVLEPALIVLSAVASERLGPHERELRRLARRYRLAIGGAAARELDPATFGAVALTGDPVSEADRATALASTPA